MKHTLLGATRASGTLHPHSAGPASHYPDNFTTAESPQISHIVTKRHDAPATRIPAPPPSRVSVLAQHQALTVPAHLGAAGFSSKVYRIVLVEGAQPLVAQSGEGNLLYGYFGGTDRGVHHGAGAWSVPWLLQDGPISARIATAAHGRCVAVWRQEK